MNCAYELSLIGKWIGFWHCPYGGEADTSDPTEYRLFKVLGIAEGGLLGIDAATGEAMVVDLDHHTINDIQVVGEEKPESRYCVCKAIVPGDFSPTMTSDLPANATCLDFVEMDLPHPLARMIRESLNTIERVRRAAGMQPGPWYFLEQSVFEEEKPAETKPKRKGHKKELASAK